MKTDTLREKFLTFFESKKHKILDSDSLVPAQDPTILFTPAGMNQFKREFMGTGRPLKRAATSQRCLRTDDLDKVGNTSAHHTLFEMLGNFSFGNYFKEEAIVWAWEFLTKILKMDESTLWVSVYKDDDEAYDIWKEKIKIPEVRIVRLGDKENFWPSEAKTKGPNGPCGPCSEIFFDFGASVGCKRADCGPACDCDRFVEVWNLVFTQYNRKNNGELEPLPRKNIDTGMGLERLAAVMQGVQSNFETDLFHPLLKEINSAVSDDKLINNKLIYAVADHIRAVTFAIYDKVLPSNEDRGYVIRKLIRRSVMHLSKLGIHKAFLYRLVPVVAHIMRKPYPQLKDQQEDISSVVLGEEESFLSILDSAQNLLNQAFSDRQQDTGRVAFQLYDTYGVPLEITCEWLKHKGMKFNRGEFNRLLDLQKKRSRIASSMKGDVFSSEQLPVKLKKTKFVGYQHNQCSAKVLAILKDNSEVKKISAGLEVEIILDTSVFYPESGGQVTDLGSIIKSKSIFEVTNTRRLDGVLLHAGKLKIGTIKKNDAVEAEINLPRRMDIQRNHTATHILQSALRAVLGMHVKQQGSLVAADRLRFDFTHFKNISEEELAQIEAVVNKHVRDNDKVNTRTMQIEEARKTGALAFFEDKYQKTVRVLEVGDYSRELCGGTHLTYTGSIGLFKIVSEGSVASGVRRIEAITGEHAYAKMRQEQDALGEVLAHLKVPLSEAAKRVEKLFKEVRDLQKKKTGSVTERLQLNMADIVSAADDFSGIKLIAKFIPDAEESSLRSLVDSIKKKCSKTICLLVAKKGEKAVLVMGVTPDLTGGNFNAGYLVKQVAQAMQGSGGGRADFAFGAGDLDKKELGFTKLRETIADLCK